MLPIREIWKQNRKDKEAGVAWWDSMAGDFSKHSLPNSETSMTIRIIEREGMITKGCSVLDVGCGSGRFSFALSEMGAQTTGVDLSPKMIEFASLNASEYPKTAFYIEDWHTLDLKEKGYVGAFDMVLANMTPAVTSAETFLKLSEASKNWCLMVKPSRRTNSVLDKLNEIVGARKDTDHLDETVSYAFTLLWQEGLSPRLEYQQQVWEGNKPIEEAIYQYTKRIESMHELDDSKRHAIKEYLESVARDGVVSETTNTTIVAMYWQVK